MAASGPISIEEYRRAIRTVLVAGQSYSLSDGRTVTNANLGELQEALDAAERREASAGKGMFRRVALGRPQ